MKSEAHSLSLLTHILINERFYFAKFIDCFCDKVPEAHQRALLAYIVEEVPNDKWERRVDDPFARIELVKSMLFHYCGREDIKSEPSRKDLAALIENYLDSKEFLMAEAEAERGPDEDKEAFTAMMGEIDG